jgi:hypothetical protein
MPDGDEMLNRLSKLGTRVRSKTELDRFAEYVEAGAIITTAHAFGVCAGGGESERWFRPDGGLTEAVYRLAGDDEERSILARGILEGELVRRGHDYRAIRDTLDRYERDDLRDLVEAHSFGPVADALGEFISTRAAEPRPGRRVQTVEAVEQNDGHGVELVPDREREPLAEVLRRLAALEEVSQRPAWTTTAWEAMAHSLARIADRLDPPAPDIVDSTYVASRLGCTTTWIADQARNGEIPRSCIVTGTGRGKPWKFYRSSIDRWIDSR